MKLFEGEQHHMVALRDQVNKAAITKREWHGTAGFATDFAVPDETRLVGRPNYSISDVIGHIEGMQQPVMFHVHVIDGVMTGLCADSFDEVIPNPAPSFELSFFQEPRLLDVPGFDPPPPPIRSRLTENPFPLSRVRWRMSIEQEGVVVTRTVVPITWWLIDKLVAIPLLAPDLIGRIFPVGSSAARVLRGPSARWSQLLAARTFEQQLPVKKRGEVE